MGACTGPNSHMYLSTKCLRHNQYFSQDRQRAEGDRHAVVTARAEAERKCLSSEPG